ncbi:MAG: phosphoribosylglycinamide formyltransferase [Cyclobacteriaceae bacterium]|nr:phosphoribosylglycinamide formyltransferase [Cyclobacteriaceae bacterium]
MRYRIAIFASGNGTNAEAIIRHFKNHPSISVALVLTNNETARVLDRAAIHGIPSMVFSRTEFTQTQWVVEKLRLFEVTHLVLAGFLWMIPTHLLQAYPGKIINIHPSLLPDFGGKGMYGLKVHQAVVDAGVSQTGISIHLVNEHYDEGKLLFQAKCPVHTGEQPQQVAERVHALEYQHYPVVIEQWIQDSITSL